MNAQEPRLAVLLFYAYALTLSAVLLCRDIPLQQASTQSTELAMLAWLLINRRQFADD
jgi:hypothetical protein